jgi:F-type H+-transporting ATPase subunit a
MKKNKKLMTLVVLILVVTTMAVFSYQLRSRTGFEEKPISEEIAPQLIFSIGPIQVSSTVINTWVMIGVLGVASYLIGRSFKVRPGMVQNAIEWLIEAIEGIISKNIGKDNVQSFLPLIAGLAIFIGVANLLGLIPGLRSPTPDINTPLAMALIVFVSVPYFGIKTKGFWRYIKHYFEPIFLMLPIEITSEFAHTLSLSFRLFGNIMGEEIIIAILFMIAPFIVPVPMMLFSIFTGVLQAYIFTLLACVYIGGAVKAHQS